MANPLWSWALATAAAYATVYGRNWWKWRQQERDTWQEEMMRLEDERGPMV